MIPHRLSNPDIVARAELLPADQVAPGDWRLQHVDEAACRRLVATDPRVHFVSWPDASLGVVMLATSDLAVAGELNDWLLIASYNKARDYLEWLWLQLLDLSVDTSAPQ